MKACLHFLFFSLAILMFGIAPCHAALYTSSYGTLLPAVSDTDDTPSSQINFSGAGQSINFFGSVYSGLFVSPNGYVTFRVQSNSYTPTALDVQEVGPMIAGLYTDLDSRTDTASNVYINTSSPGELIVTWENMGHFPQDYTVRSTFQLVIRSSQFLVPQGQGQIGFFFGSITDPNLAAAGFGDGLPTRTQGEQSIYDGPANGLSNRAPIWFNINAGAPTIGTRANSDFNGDGKSDIVLQLTDGSTYIALLNGTSFVSGGFQTGPGSNIKVVGVGDFNGDGKADLAWQQTDGSIYIGLMNGSSFVSGGFLTGPGTSKVLGVGDFNGDGKADIVLQLADGSIYIALLNGTSFVSGGFLTGPGTSKVVGVGDFNGDGKADIVLQLADGSTYIALVNGTSFISGGFQTGAGSTIKVVGVGDFNGDGKADLVWQLTDGSTYIGLMNGTSFVSGGFQTGPGSTIKVVGVRDFNGDSKADLAWQQTDGSIYIGVMDGTSFVSGAFLTGPGSLVVKP